MHIISLTSQPHIQTVAVKDLGLHQLAAFRQFFHHPGGGQTVQDGLNVGAGVLKPDVPQLAAVHELNALAHLPFLEAVLVGDVEPVVGHGKVRNAVHPVDGGRAVLRVGKVVFLSMPSMKAAR